MYHGKDALSPRFARG
jgi:glutathione S-transferase